jgi:hypothetical protein
MFAGHLLMGSAQIAAYVYRLLRPHRVAIYGPSLAGKTTLDQYLTVPGDIDPIPLELRTTHPVKNGSYLMPHGSKKQVRWKGERVPISTTDIGGQSQYWNMWAEDMLNRNASIVFFVVDDRVGWSEPAMQEAVAGFKYLTDIIVNHRFPSTFTRSMKKQAKNYKPKVVCLVLNKMDLWWTNECQQMWDLGLKRQHPMVMPFQTDMRRLRRAAIATNVEAMAAQYGLNVEAGVIRTIDMM